MSLQSRLIGRLARNALPALVPLVARRTNAELLTLLPGAPIPGVGGKIWEDLQAATGRDAPVFFFNFLRNACQGVPPEVARDRIDRYVSGPIVRSELVRRQVRGSLGVPGLSSITISPTVICNLECELCYNLYDVHEHHDRNEILPMSTISRVVGEARALGAFRVSLIGGEPLILWRELIGVFRDWPDVLFTVFTNGQLVTDELARAYAALGNVELAFSLDGFQETNDAMRGAGTYERSLAGMARYRDAGGLVLCSPTVTSDNHREILSDSFLDLMRDHGAYMAYLHHYDLVGGQERVEYLLSREQLLWMDRRIREIHDTRSFSVLSNVVSDVLRGGCAAVKEFVHVNHRGEVEACCMVPFAADSVLDKPLLEVLRTSRFFAELDAIDPDDGGIKRCLVGENSGALRDAVARGDAKPAHKLADAVFAHADDAELHERLPTCFSGDSLRAENAERARAK